MRVSQRLHCVLILSFMVAPIAAQPSLFLSLDPLERMPMGSFPGFVVFPVYFLADDLPAIDQWSAGLSVSKPGYTVVSFEAWNAQVPVEATFGDFIVELAECASPISRQALMTVRLGYFASPTAPSEVLVCPWSAAPSAPEVAGYSLCTSPDSVPFASMDDRSCVVLQPVCMPQIELRVSLGSDSAPSGALVRIPLDFQKTILRGTDGCPPILLCAFCTPNGGTWELRWDPTVASFEGFDVDARISAEYYDAHVTPIAGGIELQLENSGFADSISNGRIGELVLRMADVPVGSSTALEVEWIEALEGGWADNILESSHGLLTVTAPVRQQSVSFGGMKAKY